MLKRVPKLFEGEGHPYTKQGATLLWTHIGPCSLEPIYVRILVRNLGVVFLSLGVPFNRPFGQYRAIEGCIGAVLGYHSEGYDLRGTTQ